MPVGGHPQPVAAVAEMVAQGADEPDLSCRTLDLVSDCGAVQPVIRQGVQLPQDLDPLKARELTFFRLEPPFSRPKISF